MGDDEFPQTQWSLEGRANPAFRARKKDSRHRKSFSCIQ
jgi:hypothetical protein